MWRTLPDDRSKTLLAITHCQRVATTKNINIKSTTVYVPRRNWDSSNPSLARECAPSLQNRGEGAHSPAGEGLGESQFRRLESKLSTLLYYVVATKDMVYVDLGPGTPFRLAWLVAEENLREGGLAQLTRSRFKKG